MSTHDHLQQQEFANEAPLRQRLLREIAGISSPPPAKPTSTATAEAEENEEGNCHPFRDLNVTNFVRQVDWPFLHRWLEGMNPGKKPQAQPNLRPANECPSTKQD